jgi:hypothetical protein
MLISDDFKIDIPILSDSEKEAIFDKFENALSDRFRECNFVFNRDTLTVTVGLEFGTALLDPSPIERIRRAELFAIAWWEGFAIAWCWD